MTTKRTDQLRSANYINALMDLRRKYDRPNDPLWFELDGRKWRITEYINGARYTGSKYVILRSFNNQDMQMLTDTEVFGLKPLGKIKQIKVNGLSKDVFELPEEIERLWFRLHTC